VRECAEETGMAVIAGGELGRRAHPVTRRVVVYVACAPTDPEGEPGVVAQDELIEVLWLSPVEVGERMPDLFEPVREHLGIGLRR
jgi:8-oxo-dGTP diphosphatase